MADSASTNRRTLGRGLGALITNTDLLAARSGTTLPAPELDGTRTIAVSAIAANPHQPRTDFDEDALRELAASIREHGIIQPLIVTQRPGDTEGFWLIAGERRWRAAQLAVLDQVPAIVREASPQQLVEWALVENVQRADLSPLEEAAAYQALVDEFDMTQAEVAARVGKSRSAVANTIRLLQLPRPIQEAVANGTLSAGHARALLALPSEAAMLAAYDEVLAGELSVRQTESLVKTLLEHESADREVEPELKSEIDAAPEAQIQAHIRFLEDRLRTTLGTRVHLNRNSDGSGRLVVHFFNDGDLEQIYTLIAGDIEA